jgi:hypothetical protein
MSFSMSQASLPTFEIGLNALSAILDKAEAFAAAKKIDPAVLLNTRLAPDMFPLVRQVQVATDLAKNGAARLAGVEPPRYEDKETTIAELKARLAKTVAFVKSLDPKSQRGGRSPDHVSAWPDQQRADARRRLPQPLRAAERIFPPRRRLRDPASLRCGDRKAGFPRCDSFEGDVRPAALR